MDNKQVGKLGEELAEKFLLEKGYQMMEKNYLKRVGEIDLIAFDPKKQEWVFIEVKTRRSKTFGHPEEAITKNKVEKMEKTALNWLGENKKIDQAWRIDVVSVEWGKEKNITHLENVSL